MHVKIEKPLLAFSMVSKGGGAESQFGWFLLRYLICVEVEGAWFPSAPVGRFSDWAYVAEKSFSFRMLRLLLCGEWPSFWMGDGWRCFVRWLGGGMMMTQ